jgi:hypothetical protein
MNLAPFFEDSAKQTGVSDTIIMTELSAGRTSVGLASGTRLLPLCPTRWCVRARSLGTLLKHYDTVLAALDVLSNEPGPTGTKADGFVMKLRSFECFLTLRVAYKVFAITEELGTTLQNKKMSLSGARENVKSVTSVLESMRSEDQFLAIWTDTMKLAENLKLKPPKLPRSRRAPSNLDDGVPAHSYSDCLTYHKVKTWYRLLECLVGQIKARFSAASFDHIVNAENLLMKAAQGLSFTDELIRYFLHYHDLLNHFR